MGTPNLNVILVPVAVIPHACACANAFLAMLPCCRASAGLDCEALLRQDLWMPPDLQNISCAQFAELSDAEKRLVVIGIANGRGMTAGLFEAYAGVARETARDTAEREGIEDGYQKIRELMQPLLGIDAVSLLNGISAACARPEFQDKLLIDAVASVHVDAARALRESNEKR